MEGFKPERVLENRLSELLTPQPAATSVALPASFLDQLANGKATPGGGSASAFAGAMAAALAAMVARSTVNKLKYAGVKDQMWVLVDQAEALRADLAGLVDQDTLVFQNIMSANTMTQETAEQQSQRRLAIENASIQAAGVPLQVCRKALQALQLALEAASLGNQNAIADAVNGGILARACLSGSAVNARVNLHGLDQRQEISPILDELASLETQAGEVMAKLYTVFKDRTGIQ
jgi:formiminotetrahydrofolate cyclodeaminase